MGERVYNLSTIPLSTIPLSTIPLSTIESYILSDIADDPMVYGKEDRSYGVDPMG